MTLAIVLLLIVPLWLAITALIEHSADVSSWIRDFIAGGMPPPPDWVGALPVVGDRLAGTWNNLATMARATCFRSTWGRT